jgi:hypothetical protein
MTRAKKISITTESHEVFVMKFGSNDRAYGFCSECGQEVQVVNIDQAVTVTKLKTADLIRRIDANEFHGIETVSGHLLVCGKSLRQRQITLGDEK